MPAPTPSGASADDATAAAAANAAAELRSDGVDTTVTEEDPKARPEWCPEKFAKFNEDGTFNASSSAIELSKAHSGLETRFTQDQQAANTQQGEDTQNGDDSTQNGDDLPASDHEPLTDASFWESLTDEYNKTGALSDESRVIVRDLGIPDAMVDDFIAGQAARGDQYHTQVTSVLGDNGAAEYDALVGWADGHMNVEEAKVFNDAVTSGDITSAQVAIRDLKAQYVAAEGSFGGLLLGGSTGGGPQGVQPFASRFEQSAAINDPRYTRDKDYHKSVEARVDISSF